MMIMIMMMKMVMTFRKIKRGNKLLFFIPLNHTYAHYLVIVMLVRTVIWKNYFMRTKKLEKQANKIIVKLTVVHIQKILSVFENGAPSAILLVLAFAFLLFLLLGLDLFCEWFSNSTNRFTGCCVVIHVSDTTLGIALDHFE